MTSSSVEAETARPAQVARRGVPWELRFGLALPLPAAGVGALVTIALLGVHVAYVRAFGIALWRLDGEDAYPAALLHAGFIAAASVGYLIAAFRYVAVATTRDLSPFLSAGSVVSVGPRGIPVFGLDAPAMRRGRIAGGLGLALLFGAPLASEPNDPLNQDVRVLLVSFLLLLALLWGWGRAIYFGAHLIRETQRLAARAPDPDLLDLHRWYAFGRVGLRLALATLIAASIFILLELVDPIDRTVEIMAGMLLVSVPFAGLALIGSSRGARLRIRVAKRVELDRIDAELRALRDVRPDAPGRVADLAAMRLLVDGVREWPLDSPTLTRFALYLLIPLGSWLGGALVERFLGTLLD